MKITGARADRFLKSPPPDMIGVLLFGPDRGLVKERSEGLVQVWNKTPEDGFSVTILTADDLATDVGRLSDEMAALSLLGDQRLIRVRLDHERSASALSKIIKIFDQNPERAAARLIIEGGDMTPRSSIRKTFEAARHMAAIGCYADKGANLSNLVRSALSEENIAITPEALDMWLPLLEGDRAFIRNEIEKMCLYKGGYQDKNTERSESQVVSLEDVQNIASGSHALSIDGIVMATMSGQSLICDRAFREAVEGKINSAVILRRIQTHLGRLLEARNYMDKGKSAESAIRALRPPIFKMQERTVLRQVKLWPARALERSLSQSFIIESQIKTAGAPAEALVSRYLLALAQFAQKRL